jgi:hypothetical protein
MILIFSTGVASIYARDPSYMLAQRQKIEPFVFARRPSFQAIQVMMD